MNHTPGGANASFLPDTNSASIIRNAAPTVIAESAILNEGNGQPAISTWIKSTTLPRTILSMTFPIAPPRMSESPTGRITGPSSRIFHSHEKRYPLTAVAKAMKNQRCQPDASARKLNAAPVFRWCVILMKLLKEIMKV